ncbi:hypothetical protein SO802_032372 [Lithocarpus litseifolius]|uniref:hAT-like transposase RNase-H fold domain-containing protein n=1 Tax=Lithocarpus litseifolius TaxID=425828 RepID=A0AAW2BMY8_9ROSI
MAKFKMQKQLQGLLGISVMVVPSRWRPLMPRLLKVLLVLPIKSELLEQLVEHKFLLFSYQGHLNHRYVPEMGSEYDAKNQQNLMELQTAIKGAANVIGPKSPVTANARTHRRQSLTGIPASGKLRFAQCLSELPFLISKKVRQDVPTRWNSTYLMIETCFKYRDAFSHLSRIDKYFLNCPSEEEWERVEKIARVLEPFYDITKLFSGTNYPTANLYFHCVWKIQLRIMEQLEDDDMIIRAMAKEMKEKFDKYWEYYSPVLSFAVILDPRYKLQCVEFCYSKLYKQEAISMAANLRDTLYGIFEEYKNSTSDICNVVEVASSSGGVRDTKENRNAKTPPPVHPSTKISKRPGHQTRLVTLATEIEDSVAKDSVAKDQPCLMAFS